MAISPAMTAMNMGLGDQLVQQANDQFDQMRKKKKGIDTGAAPGMNGGAGSVSLSPAASMLFGGKL